MTSSWNTVVVKRCQAKVNRIYGGKSGLLESLWFDSWQQLEVTVIERRLLCAEQRHILSTNLCHYCEIVLYLKMYLRHCLIAVCRELFESYFDQIYFRSSVIFALSGFYLALITCERVLVYSPGHIYCSGYNVWNGMCLCFQSGWSTVATDLYSYCHHGYIQINGA